MVSAMQVHAEPSYELVRDAHRMGAGRPLILAGGPKAIYEPTDYFDRGDEPGVGADCVVTGEAFVMLDLLRCVLDHRRGDESPLRAFERARTEGSLNDIPGLVYIPDDAPAERPYAINTGTQRLLRNLDEMPMPDAGYRLIEPPHRKRSLAPRPLAAGKVGKISLIASVNSTHGCKFNCSFCPIPAVNQRTWRHKSPARLAAEIKLIHENFGIREFFSTDDNFFNSRETVEELMTVLAETTTTGGRLLGSRIRFYTEATQFDVHKNQDLLPLCRKAGLRAIWFGIEDILGEVVNKGQSEGKTAELFGVMRKIGIEPMAMMIHSDEQPLHSEKGNLAGLINQARYLFNKGAVSYQCTYLGPAIGTRDIEQAAEARILYRTVGGERIPEAYFDGNHVVASRHATPWERQMNVMRAYWTFYNPINTLRVLASIGRDATFAKRLLFQIVGQIGLVLTVPKLLNWAHKLRDERIEVYDGLQQARIPMVDPDRTREVMWSIDQVRTPDLPLRKPIAEAPVPPAVTSEPLVPLRINVA
jgi:hypothetical protein